jgi:hypothetical protein
MIAKGREREREVEISDNLMTIKFDVSFIFLFNIRELIIQIKYTVYFSFT